MANYYDILGVGRDADEKQIKSAFKKLSLKYHPDRQQGKSDEEKKKAEDKFKEINEAYQCLADADKKRHYDMFGSMEGFDKDNPGGPFGGFGASPFGFGGNPFGFGGSPFGRSPQAVPGTDIRMTIPVTLEELYAGVKKTIRYKRKVRCPNCHGEGGTGVKTCPECHGSGMVTVAQRTPFGYMQESHPCGRCRGTGKIVSNVCPTCKGSGFKEAEVTLAVEFPAGCPNGGAATYMGQGNESKSIKGDAGSFIAVCSYSLDPDYAVRDQDVYQRMFVPYYDCLLGAEKTVTLPNGKKRAIKIPSCAKDELEIRLSGDGLGYKGRKGAYIILLRCEFPDALSPEDRALLAKIKVNNERIDSPEQYDKNEQS